MERQYLYVAEKQGSYTKQEKNCDFFFPNENKLVPIKLHLISDGVFLLLQFLLYFSELPALHKTEQEFLPLTNIKD